MSFNRHSLLQTTTTTTSFLLPASGSLLQPFIIITLLSEQFTLRVFYVEEWKGLHKYVISDNKCSPLSLLCWFNTVSILCLLHTYNFFVTTNDTTSWMWELLLVKQTICTCTHVITLSWFYLCNKFFSNF